MAVYEHAQQCSLRGLLEKTKSNGLDPHTNMGSLTLAVMGTQCVCVGGGVSRTHTRSLPLAPGLAECYLYMNIQQQPTYSKSFQKTLVTSMLA